MHGFGNNTSSPKCQNPTQRLHQDGDTADGSISRYDLLWKVNVATDSVSFPSRRFHSRRRVDPGERNSESPASLGNRLYN